MIEDMYLISICIIYSLVGSIARALFGLYKAYRDIPNTADFRFNWRRVLAEICVSVLLGTFGTILLSEIGSFGFGIKVLALAGGFIGADIMTLVTKKFGITKDLEIRVTDEQVSLAEFNPRQVAALYYLKTHNRITSSIYQRLNKTNPNTAKSDLNQLVRKNKLEKVGNRKARYYKLA